MTTVFPVINPSITISSSSRRHLSEEVDIGRGMVHYFANEAKNYNLTCFSKKDKKWSTQECSINLIKNTGEI